MNTNFIKGKIVEVGLTQEKLAKKLDISVQTLNAKLNGRSCLTVDQAMHIAHILNISNPSEIFFDQYIPNMQRKGTRVKNIG